MATTARFDTDEHEISAPAQATAGISVMATVTLTACGGGDEASSSTPTPSDNVPVPLAGLDQQRASRFLAQATNGATRAEIDSVVRMGQAAWLDAQFLAPSEKSHWDWLVEQKYDDAAHLYNKLSFGHSAWRQAIDGPDLVRQKVALSLLDIFVVSQLGLLVQWPHFGGAAYMDILLAHAFGNFRDLLGAITMSTAMGEYLTYIDSRKETATGQKPDENYAREIMQLFTIGLNQLNPDGTSQLDAQGQPVPSFTSMDVSQLARVFTGFTMPGVNSTAPGFRKGPLKMNLARNEPGASVFLGASVGGGGMAAVDAALDVLFNHPNVGPFLSRNLIQRLVTSNPSAGYVSRVAAAFGNDGTGKRGEMKSVLRAILLDSEARQDPAQQGATFGLLRSPVQRLTGFMRAFRARSTSGRWTVDDLRGAIGQVPGFSPSVFNFFQPSYSPSGTEIFQLGLVAPEFQVADEVTTIGYVNTIEKLVTSGLAGGDIALDLGDLEILAPNTDYLMDEIAIRICPGGIGNAARVRIKAALDSISSTLPDFKARRAKAAVLLMGVCPDCFIQK